MKLDIGEFYKNLPPYSNFGKYRTLYMKMTYMRSCMYLEHNSLHTFDAENVSNKHKEKRERNLHLAYVFRFSR
jgi:hypothetical protein